MLNFLQDSSFVPGYGSGSAKLMVIAEATTQADVESGHPLSDAFGNVFTTMLATAGLNRNDVYCTNVIKIKSDGVYKLQEKGYQVEDFLPMMWNEIDTLKPNCILALGNVALCATTGKGKYLYGPHDTSAISHYRGSILLTSQGPPKVVPTLSMSALFGSSFRKEDEEKDGEDKGAYSWRQKVYIQLDINRAIAQSKFPGYNLPNRFLQLCRSSLDFYNFLEQYSSSKFCMLDIETYKARAICISIAFNKDHSLAIPLVGLQDFRNTQAIPPSDMGEIYGILADFLYNDNIKKGNHNIKFDQTILEKEGFFIRGIIKDTLLLGHTIYPELPKQLAFYTSTHTEEPYYKSEGREFNPKKDSFDVLLRYCGKDTTVTMEVYDELWKEAKELGLCSFYDDFVIPCYFMYYDVEKLGIKINLEIRTALILRYQNILDRIVKELGILIGHEVNFNSPKQVAFVLYDELKCPRRKGVSEDDLLGLLINNLKGDKWDNTRRIIQLVQDGRSVYKALHTYILAQYDSDERIRYTVKQHGTETGRTSTGILKSPLRVGKWGISMQTLTKHSQTLVLDGEKIEYGNDIRSMFVPDDGYIFGEIDQSKAESRIADILAEDWEHLELIDKVDIHSLTASQAFNIDISEVDGEMRQVGKHSNHAYDNGVGKREFARQATRHMQATNPGSFLSEWKAGKILDAIRAYRPKIVEVFHQGVIDALEHNNCALYTPQGRYRQFFERWGRDMFKEAWAHIKQAIVGDITKLAGLETIKEAPYVQLLVESHDAWWFQVPISKLEEGCKIFKKNMMLPVDFHKGTLKKDYILNMPVEIKIGLNGQDLKKIKETKE